MFDYIIVGQGISGSLLAYHLLKKKKKVLIIDNEDPHSSSRVAAGIFNPVTGKRKVKTWQADLLFNYLNYFYPKLEEELEASFFYRKSIYMLFDSIEEQNRWAGKITDHEYKQILDINTNNSLFEPYINDSYGGILAKNSGYVDVSEMLLAFKKYMLKKNAYFSTTLDYSKIAPTEKGISYKEIASKNVIFCEGSSLSANPYFSWLPFNLVKGELLTIEVDSIPDIIFNKSIFILPLTSKKCIAGATYNWEDTSTFTTTEAKEELKIKIDQLLKVAYTVTEQRAGIRPATQDRRPFLGVHPKHKNIFIFGGLGTKGISIAPYYAEQFFEYLENGKDLENDVNINRHYSLYYPHNNNL